MKLVVPRKLATDHRELRYIEQLSGAEIITSDQVRRALARKLTATAMKR
jgi:hypothetical protein